MKLRHAAALALVGWYLMVPPTSTDNLYRIRTELPVRNYWQHSAYDSAAECEAAKKPLADQFRTNAERGPNIMKRWWEAKAESIASALCVSSDDPRLKGN